MRRLIIATVSAVSAITCSLLGAAGCGDAEPVATQCAAPGWVVADPTAWRVLVDDADDPWGPRADRCPPAQHRTEVQGDTRWHEIETRGCSAATLHQVVRADVCAADRLTLDVWHFPITEGDGDWQLQLGVFDDDGFETLAERTIPLPGAATTFTLDVEPGRRVRAGDTLWLRLTNHGTNTWNLYDLVAAPPID